jgi:hypothetical protein
MTPKQIANVFGHNVDFPIELVQKYRVVMSEKLFLMLQEVVRGLKSVSLA